MEQHSKKANHHLERISVTGAKTAIFWADEKTTGTTRGRRLSKAVDSRNRSGVDAAGEIRGEIDLKALEGDPDTCRVVEL